MILEWWKERIFKKIIKDIFSLLNKSTTLKATFSRMNSRCAAEIYAEEMEMMTLKKIAWILL